MIMNIINSDKVKAIFNEYFLPIVLIIFSIYVIYSMLISFDSSKKAQEETYMNGFNAGIMAHYNNLYNVKINAIGKPEIYKVIK